MSGFEYIILMSVFAIIPSLFLLYILRNKINFKNLGISLFILFIIGIIWDQLSVRFGIWSFSSDKIVGNLFGYSSGLMGGGPALALLLAGPSLSLPNMIVITRVIGLKKALVYICLVIIVATFVGFIYGLLGG